MMEDLEKAMAENMKQLDKLEEYDFILDEYYSIINILETIFTKSFCEAIKIYLDSLYIISLICHITKYY